MLFCKLVVIYDLIVLFLTMIYRLYLKGMSPKEWIAYKLKPDTKPLIILSLLITISISLSFVALLIFVISLMF